jgi:hypothetical protein
MSRIHIVDDGIDITSRAFATLFTGLEVRSYENSGIIFMGYQREDI